VLCLDGCLEGAAVGCALCGLVLEHGEGSTSGVGLGRGSCGLLLVEGLDELPLARALEGNEVRGAVKASNDDLGLVEEHAVAHGEEVSLMTQVAISPPGSLGASAMVTVES